MKQVGNKNGLFKYNININIKIYNLFKKKVQGDH